MVNPAYLVGAGGIVGAVLRYTVSEVADIDGFPLGTLTVNIIGSFLLGFVMFFGIEGDLLLFLGTGISGSFTTFSSFSVDTVRLWESNSELKAVLYAFLNLVGAFIAIGIAWGLIRII